jgi:predicted phage tail protein
LTWSPAGGAVSSYVIEAGSAPGRSDLASFSTGTTAASFFATSVPAGTYFVRVRAASVGGAGPPSNEVTAIVMPCVVPPPPGNLAASVSGSTVALTWTASSGATSYEIAAGSAPGADDILVSDLGSAATSLTAANVSANTYFVRLRSKNACGVGPPSNETIVIVR